MSVPQSQPPWAPSNGGPRTDGAGDRRRLWVGGGAVLVLLLGTFLPWMRSGRVSRDSYQLAGVGVRRLDAGPWLESFFQGWPFLGPLWAVVATLALLGLRRTAGLVALVLAVLCALVATGGLYVAVRVETAAIDGVALGPAVTLVGALGAMVAAIGMLRPAPGRRPGEPPAATAR